MMQNFQSGAAQHAFYRSAVGNPPIRGIVRITLFNEVHGRKIRVGEHFVIPEGVIFVPQADLLRAANHGLEDKSLADLLNNFVESKKGIAQVIKQSHEQDVVELTRYLVHVINRTLLKINFQVKRLRRETGLA